MATLGLAALFLVDAEPSRARDLEGQVAAETLDQHWASSVEAYTLLVTVEPENGQAWFRLGSALHHTADYAGAIRAFERSEVLEFMPARTRYHLAVNHALLGHGDEASYWLRRAREADLVWSDAEPDDEVCAVPEPVAPVAWLMAGPCRIELQPSVSLR